MKNVLVLVSILLVVGCGDDDGTSAPSQETTGTITGTLTLTGDGCPTENITIALFTADPSTEGVEAGPPAAFTSDFTIENNSYSYTISDIVFGTYEYLAVGWDDPADPESDQIGFAVYGQNFNSTTFQMEGTPTPVTLSVDSPTLEDADIVGDCIVITYLQQQ
jgi:hypothetical protein